MGDYRYVFKFIVIGDSSMINTSLMRWSDGEIMFCSVDVFTRRRQDLPDAPVH